MSARSAGAALGTTLLLVAGAVLLAAGVLADPLRGLPLDYGVQQSLFALLGALCLLEGALKLAGRPAPALWSALTGEGRSGTALAYAIALAIGATLLYHFRAYAADDSFITFRFARNLARGAGVVWNPGQPPVEGYSNFLWMLLSAAALRLGLDPLTVARVVAFACYGASLVAVRALALAAGASPRHANLPVLLFAAVPAFAYWAVSGLETLSVVLLSLLYFLALAREADPRTLPWRTALVADLLLLSRPETPVIVVLAVLPLLVPFSRERGAWLLRLVLLALPVAALYLGWKGLTFHRLFANTVAAKLHYMAGETLVTGFFLFAFPLVVALVASLARGARTLERQVLLVATGLAAGLLHTASPVGHYHRFFLPVLAPMLATVAVLADRWEAATGGAARRATAMVFALAMLYGLAPLVPMVTYANDEATGLARAHVQVGHLLRRTFTPDHLLAASDCGVIPYLSEMRALDIWGLTDRSIAEKGFDPGYVMQAGPDVIVLHSLHPGVFDGRDTYDRELQPLVLADPSYHLVGEWKFVTYWLWVYSRAPLR